MSIKVRLIIMNFLQFFVWGSWLISLGGYMGRELHFEGGQIGAIFATMGIASLVMPGIIGIIADKWFNAERLYGLCHNCRSRMSLLRFHRNGIRPDVLGHCYSTCWYICPLYPSPTRYRTMHWSNTNVT